MNTWFQVLSPFSTHSHVQYTSEDVVLKTKLKFPAEAQLLQRHLGMSYSSNFSFLSNIKIAYFVNLPQERKEMV